jgi:multidrug efflux pump subunit AcrA (membrane-fusion protein)
MMSSSTVKSAVLAAMLLGLGASGCQWLGNKPESGPSPGKQEGGRPDGKRGEGKGGGGGGGRGGGRGGPVTVRTMRLESADAPRTIEMVSVLSGRLQVDVYTRVAGRIAWLGPAEGKRVKEGELLFKVDRSDPGESFLTTPVVSPVSGWVARWYVNSLGFQVSTQDPVVTIVDDEVLRAVVALPADEWLKVSTSTVTRVTVGGETRKGVVERVSRAADAASGRGAVTIEVANADHGWKAGMVATIAFDLDVKPRIVVPAGSVSITDAGTYVYTVVEDKAKKRPVRIAVIDNDRVEITSGVEAGEVLVTAGMNQLSDGGAVRVLDPSGPGGGSPPPKPEKEAG